MKDNYDEVIKHLNAAIFAAMSIGDGNTLECLLMTKGDILGWKDKAAEAEYLTKSGRKAPCCAYHPNCGHEA